MSEDLNITSIPTLSTHSVHVPASNLVTVTSAGVTASSQAHLVPSTTSTATTVNKAPKAKSARKPSHEGQPRAKKRRAAAATTNYADVNDDELLKPSEIKPAALADLKPVKAAQRHWNQNLVELQTFDGPITVKMWTPDPPVFDLVPNVELRQLHDLSTMTAPASTTSSTQRSKDMKELATIKAGLARYKRQLKTALATSK